MAKTNTSRSLILLICCLLAAGYLLSSNVNAASPTTPAITENIAISGSAFANGITTTSNGNVWFAEQTANKIGFINANGTGYHEWPQATFNGGNPDISAFSEPEGITVGPDGNVWFSEYNQNKIGFINPSGVLQNEYGVTGGAGPQQITVGSNNKLWFAEHNASAIGTIATDGSGYSETSVTNLPTGITSVSGDIWFTESNAGNTASAVGEIDTNSGSLLHEYALAGNAKPNSIVADTNGHLWITELGINKLAEMDASNGNIIREISLATPNAGPAGITIGPDGIIWFTESTGNAVGSISNSGSNLTEYPITTGANALSIANGANRTLWFTESGRDVIGEIQVPQAVTTSGSSIATNSSKAAPKDPNTGFGLVSANATLVFIATVFSTFVILIISKLKQFK